MSFSNTFAYAVARAADVATASVFTKHTDCTISSLCDVALEKNGDRALQRLGRVLNWIRPGHTREARLSDIAKGQAIVDYLSPVPK
jgi:hypothetical protein